MILVYSHSLTPCIRILSLLLSLTLFTLLPWLLLQSFLVLSFYLLSSSMLSPALLTSLLEALSLSMKVRTQSNRLLVSLLNLCTPLLCPFSIESLSLRKVKTLIVHGRSTVETTRFGVRTVQQLVVVEDGVVEEPKVFAIVDGVWEVANGFEEGGNKWF
ncbi:hypothetical protein GmHk_02G004575 [Glycine max]|nr:hypothetical protein GmHk_02G004575 [Glycine max]